jgi:hypothetical protein
MQRYENYREISKAFSDGVFKVGMSVKTNYQSSEGIVEGIIGSVGTSKFYIFQNKKDGSVPDNFEDIKGEYKLSWCVKVEDRYRNYWIEVGDNVDKEIMFNGHLYILKEGVGT